MNLETIINKLKEPFNINVGTVRKLPRFLALCTAMNRSGVSAYRVTADILKLNEECGIPIGPNPDGSPNLINQLIYNCVKTYDRHQKLYGVGQVLLPTGSIICHGAGANAGGPFEITVTNVNPLEGLSIPR